MVLPTPTHTAATVHFTTLPLSLWPRTQNFLDNSPALSPPIASLSLAHPFTISPDVYNFMLSPIWPVSVALVYATTVIALNKFNKDRGHKPWAISRTTAFWIFQVLHNLFLAAYSAWTFIGMLNAIQNSWPGLDGKQGLAGAADALCKLHGPRGAGSAAVYNTTTGSWSISDITMKLVGGLPDPTDVGRIWNEGLAFYGWLFYLSKYYEVVDTFLILVKGKQTSMLQVYHHAGAMLSMWAGIRFMSPPIWMFTFLNSGIHTIMYTYYTITSFGIRVPRLLKQTLTALQILQIIFGTTYALAHLFISYDVPYYATFHVVDNLSTAIPSIASSISSAVATPSIAANLGSWLKKAGLRAAGAEGLAENVRNAQGETFGPEAIHAADVRKAQEYMSYKLDMTRTHCLDTSGEVLAILLNVAYLIPLTFLFLKFFARYYQARTDGQPKPTRKENAKRSAKDGARDIGHEIAQAMREDQGGPSQPPADVQATLDDAKDRANKAGGDFKQRSKAASEQMQQDLKVMRTKAQDAAADTQENLSGTTANLADKSQQAARDAGAVMQDITASGTSKAKEVINHTKDQMESPASPGQNAQSEGKKHKKKKHGNNHGGGQKGSTTDGADPKAYEANSDVLKSEKEKKAEAEMQPKSK